MNKHLRWKRWGIVLVVAAAYLVIAPQTLMAKNLDPAMHLSPRQVVQQYCNLDMRGARLSSQNPYNDAIFALVAWPDEPGWDSATIVAACKVQRMQIGELKSEICIQYTVLGTMSGLSVLRAENHPEVVTFVLKKFKGDWKISRPLIRPHVSVDAAIASLRTLLSQHTDPQESYRLHKTIATLRSWEDDATQRKMGPLGLLPVP